MISAMERKKWAWREDRECSCRGRKWCYHFKQDRKGLTEKVTFKQKKKKIKDMREQVMQVFGGREFQAE